MLGRTAGTAIAVLGLAAPLAPARAEVASYPAAEVLSAVRAACGRLTSLPDAHAHVRAVGWTRIEDASATPIGPLMSFAIEQGSKIVAAGGGSMQVDKGVYRRTVAGEELWLALSGVTIGGRVVHGCRVYDVGETRRISARDAADWLGREPDEAVDRPELMRAEWEPGVNAGQDSFELFFVPANSPVLQFTKVDGIAFKADWIGIERATRPAGPSSAQEKK